MIYSGRRLLIMLHDLVATGAALLAAFYLRFEEAGFVARLGDLAIVLPCLIVCAFVVYWYFGLYRGKWRFASLPDLANILRSATVLAVGLLIVDYVLVAPNVRGEFLFGKITIILYWGLQIFLLGGSRFAYRSFRLARVRHHATGEGAVPILVLGRAADAEVLLRSVETGAVRNLRPVGILSPSPADHGQSIRGIAVRGDFGAIERVVGDLRERGTEVRRLVLTPSAFEKGSNVDGVLVVARRLGLITNRLPSLEDGAKEIRLLPVVVEDLLLRSTVPIDYRRLETFVRGKAIVVSGGGGSIGSEICDRVVTFGASRLLVIENAEPALHAVLETLSAKGSDARIEGRIADVRDRERIHRLIVDFAPDLVFHAAALKHVPILERDWGEGIKTNVFGSVAVADAAVAAGAAGFVMISTDKAIEPVSVLGATKRFAEMYCQALDAELARKAVAGTATRLISVRFGNVLASNGSVVPKFRAQIEAGGPVTVTHPDMVRYFMTIREACDLVVTAASHAFGDGRGAESVFVLNMGQPVKIIELAERMIKLSGLEVGRDVEIVYTGVRPGERMHEILFAREEPTVDIGLEGVFAAHPVAPPGDVMREWLLELANVVKHEDREAAFRVLRQALPDFRGEVA